MHLSPPGLCGGSYLDKAMVTIKYKKLSWAANFSTTQYIGMNTGSTFVNPLHQLWEGGSKVLSALEQVVCSMLLN